MASPKDLIEFLEYLHGCVQEWPKGSSLFLDLVGEKLRLMETQLIDEITPQLPKSDAETKRQDAEASKQNEVYVALYQFDGHNLDKWAQILNTISFQGVSRPIYAKEEEVCSMIRGKEKREKEAYAVVKVPDGTIIPGTTSQDKQGYPLLHLKQGTLQSKLIFKFVHVSGQYLWQNGKLIKLDAPSPLATGAI